MNKVSLLQGATAIELLPRISEQYQCQLYIKRDDCTGLALGGNKARKLEYLVAEALAQGADTLVTLGGLQSNHARQTAAAATKYGLDAVLILDSVVGTPVRHYPDSGNILLDKIFGATIVQTDGNNSDQVLDKTINQLVADGKKPYVIPVGGSSSLGALGYVDCGKEIANQMQAQHLEFDLIVHATGSGGTQAGLVTGLTQMHVDTSVLGMCVSRDGEAQEELVWSLTQQMQADFKFEQVVQRQQIKADGRFYGQGYGRLNVETVATIKKLATCEGILLDPVYTGKAMTGLLALLSSKQLHNKRILFLHTGGAPALFAYQDELFS